MRAWVVFVVAGLGTYAMRASFIMAGSRLTLPEWIERSLRYVGPAVFAAIVAPPILGDRGVAATPERIPEILAVLVSALVAWRTGRVLWVLVVGMSALWILRALGL
ncbi:MAG: AzlD domain-containing protein [Actinomycetota bacterium]